MSGGHYIAYGPVGRDVQRPNKPGIFQLEQVYFDPIMGQGEWALYHYDGRNHFLKESRSWTQFETICRIKLKSHASEDEINNILTLMSNFKIVNFDSISHEIYLPGIDEVAGKVSLRKYLDRSKPNEVSK